MSDSQTATATVRSTAEIATPQAGRYLTQLCKHFQHKCAVTLDDASGHIAFSTGDCRLRAGAGILTLFLCRPPATRSWLNFRMSLRVICFALLFARRCRSCGALCEWCGSRCEPSGLRS